MIVVKLGGSLTESGALMDCLNAVERKYPGQTVVIVPGGGKFSDQVRLAQQRWGFDDSTAHRMAILAMQQMALLFNGLKSRFAVVDSVQAIRARSALDKTLIWSPSIPELDRAGISASWDITSDSLAAWLAKSLAASELILVKSAIIEENLSPADMTERSIVDRAFFDFVTQSEFRIQIIHQQAFIEA